MNETAGVVVRLEGDYAWVRAQRAENACGSCSRREGCHGLPTNGEAYDMRLRNLIDAHPGDKVVIQAAEGVVLRAVWAAYGLPLLLALTAAILVFALSGSQGAAVLGALTGLFGGFTMMHFRRRDGQADADSLFSMNFKTCSSINQQEV